MNPSEVEGKKKKMNKGRTGGKKGGPTVNPGGVEGKKKKKELTCNDVRRRKTKTQEVKAASVRLSMSTLEVNSTVMTAI